MRNSERLRDNWLFSRHDFDNTENVDFDDSRWRKVKVPHDWGIEGGFYKGYDAQFTRIVNNFEESESLHLGRTGGLPHAGRGVYRRKIYLAPELIGKKIFRLEFDGVMSHSQIFLNGKSVGGRAYGYSSFACDITDAAVPGENVLTVKAENFEAAARWYPGGGIYRNVRLLTLDKQHFMYNGVWVRTLNIVGKRAEIAIAVETAQKVDFLQCEITSPAGEVVYSGIVEKNLLELELNGFSPWSCEKPLLYSAKIALLDEKSQLLDEVSVKFGIRAMSFSAEDGFMLNGKKMVFNGVCMHHDLGPLGAAFSLPAARRQLKILQSIGVNALRCTHNPPAPEVLDLCDELGILVIDEAFDCWKMGKVKNDYHRDFDLWHERDLVDMIKRDRNHPSVMLWSIGNEILEQGNTDGWKLAEALQNIVHATDPDRPATAGLSFEFGALTSGIAKVVDVPGFNYKPHRYEYYHNELPGKAIFGSETASTVSTRGEYYYPITEGFVDHPSIQCSSYDVEYPAWATTPDREFHFQDKNSYVMGEFVWTGFDYLGEPCPFDYQWPAHSAYFGIFDLVGLPKDRAYLYCSRFHPEIQGHLH